MTIKDLEFQKIKIAPNSNTNITTRDGRTWICTTESVSFLTIYGTGFITFYCGKQIMIPIIDVLEIFVFGEYDDRKNAELHDAANAFQNELKLRVNENDEAKKVG